MARGWESKSVEAQISDAEQAGVRVRGRDLTPEERVREDRKATLRLARARALQDLQQACDKRHRALLGQTLEHLDAELAKLT